MYIGSMSRQYSIAEARVNLPTIVDQAEAGQQVELTRHGKPVAVVISLRGFARLCAERVPFGVAYQHFLKANPLNDVGLNEGSFASTRTKDAGRKVGL